ncbi:hypothetical protein LIER_19788 [Lithospermum erythrorhizon]|uniref:Uncharacterized protein n=1 Tax=Lithospermum erythrorhizon TaxID=34254 RepID=A0AAV3QPK7_LITER
MSSINQSISNSVPKALMAIDQDSYVPQQTAIGPYHYRRPEMHEMERYKLGASKWMQKQLHNLRFEDVVTIL